MFLKIWYNPQENTCARAILPYACQFVKKETLAQVFSCELCEFSKNTFSYRTVLLTASDFPSRWFAKFTRPGITCFVMDQWLWTTESDPTSGLWCAKKSLKTKKIQNFIKRQAEMQKSHIVTKVSVEPF